jgi:amino acid permease
MVIALTLAQSLIALQRYAVTAFAWVIGVGVFVVAMVTIDVDVFTRAEIAFVASTTMVAVLMLFVAGRALRDAEGGFRSRPPEPDSLSVLEEWLPKKGE